VVEGAAVNARDVVLGRVRGAIGGTASEAARARGYRTVGTLDPAACVALFCERVGEYRADVRRVPADEVGTAVADVCAALAAGRLVVPRGLPAAWRPQGVELVADDALSAAELDGIEGVLTGCTVAIAETGTLVLTAAPAEGRRAITLVPDLHICVVEERQVVELVPQAIAALTETGATRRPLTLISGPSATSDIELSRVEGVHGPRTLVVLVAGAGAYAGS
jgi:L-lactate dehydrogenase complex protein LldG